jgi:hypothetical protein
LAQLGRFADGAAARLRQDQNRGLAPADLDPVALTRIIIVGGARRPSSGTSPATAEPATRPSAGNSH